MTAESEYETLSEDGPQCPYCGYQITADEPSYFDEMRYTDDECQDCGKSFEVSVYTSTTWNCHQKDSNNAEGVKS